VNAEREHQLDNRLHSRGIVLVSSGPSSFELRSKLTRASRVPCRGESGRRLVWQQQRDVEQSGQGKQAPCRARSSTTSVSSELPPTIAIQRTAVSGLLARGSRLLSHVAIRNEAPIGPMMMPARRV
jgi:hypothetical protein